MFSPLTAVLKYDYLYVDELYCIKLNLLESHLLEILIIYTYYK